MLRSTKEDVFTIQDLEVYPGSSLHDIQIRMGYSSRYKEGDEVKIIASNKRHKGEEMKIVQEGFCKLRFVKGVGK